MCVNDLTKQDSRGDEILVPSAEAISRPYEPAQTARQPAQQQGGRPRYVHFSQVEPDLQGLTLGQPVEGSSW